MINRWRHLCNFLFLCHFQIKWLNVGVLSGEEETVDGYVLQSDHDGIKATWRASDPQSGVTIVTYAVGTYEGIT
jgi:hypothetical protein